jgi:NDP-sugar pyrophosphorylase family protein
MEAIILAGGKAERLGDAARGLPKALVPVAGKPLLAHQAQLLVRAGVERLIVSCAAGKGALFEEHLADPGLEVGIVEEPEPLGRGGGLRYAATARREAGDVFALNGDELVDVDLSALLAAHQTRARAATITLVPLRSPFGIVELDDEDDAVRGFQEAPSLPYWVSCGVYVLGEEALARLPERGDHETSTFPELAATGRLGGFRHEGVWLTVNTPKDLRRCEEYLAEHPAFLTA